jgi:hypothetical protein
MFMVDKYFTWASAMYHGAVSLSLSLSVAVGNSLFF